MVGFQPMQYRPPVVHRHIASAQPGPKMGSLSSLGVTDWLLMGGGAVVAGAGLNTIYGGLTARKTNFIGLTLGVVLAAVGVAVVGSEVTKLSA